MTNPNEKYKIDPTDPEFFFFDEKKAHCFKIRVVDRAGWGAAPAREEQFQPKLVNNLVMHYDSGVDPCHNDDECAATMRELQRRHMDQGLPDIAYNFMIGGDGTIYEGTGWDNKSWTLKDEHAHMDGSCYHIAYIGRFSYDNMPYTFMPRAAVNWVNHAVLGRRLHCYFHLTEDSRPRKDDPIILDLNDW